MNALSYQAPVNAGEIVLPSDGTASPYELNPVAGVQYASATPANAPVMVGGVQLSAQQAREYGFISDTQNQVEVVTPAKGTLDQATDASLSDYSQNDVRNSSSDDDDAGFEATAPELDSGTQEVLESLLSDRGDVAMQAINSVLDGGDLTEANLSDLANASGLSFEQAQHAFEDVTEHLDGLLGGQSSLLSLAAESDSTATKSAILSALHGSPEEAQRLIAAASSTMDVSSQREALVDALEENGYAVTFQQGRLYLQGNEFPVSQPWSRVFSQFELDIT